MDEVRSYDDLIKDFVDLDRLGLIKLQRLDKKLPLHIIHAGEGERKVFLSGGIHGHEPAGTYAIAKFLESKLQNYIKSHSFVIFPCVNPYGFERDVKENSSSINVNISFKGRGYSVEAAHIIRFLDNLSYHKFDFAMDFHETVASEETGFDNPTAFYLWELCKRKDKRVGPRMVTAVKKLGLEICADPTIYRDTNTNGVIYYPEGASGEFDDAYTIENYMWKEAEYSDHVFTIETPSHLPLEQRVKAHIASLEVALRNI